MTALVHIPCLVILSSSTHLRLPRRLPHCVPHSRRRLSASRVRAHTCVSPTVSLTLNDGSRAYRVRAHTCVSPTVSLTPDDGSRAYRVRAHTCVSPLCPSLQTTALVHTKFEHTPASLPLCPSLQTTALVHTEFEHTPAAASTSCASLLASTAARRRLCPSPSPVSASESKKW
jgi:hypothetical protein